jgi:hypothetical protein
MANDVKGRSFKRKISDLYGSKETKLKDSVDNIRGKLQEIKDMQPQKSISFGKATNPIEGLETQIWFGRMQLILNTMMKLVLSMSKKSIFGNDKMMRQDVMKRRK